MNELRYDVIRCVRVKNLTQKKTFKKFVGD